MNICLSIVVPTYQRPIALLQCLKALMLQSFDKYRYEIIVVSDGPDMVTHQIVFDLIRQSPAAPVITFCYLPHKKGTDAARNFGWQMAKGEFVAFINDDHIATETWVENFWNEYKSHRNEPIVFTGNVTTNRVSFVNAASVSQQDVSSSNCAISKSTLHKIKGFDEDLSKSWGDQNALHFKMLNTNIPIVNVSRAATFNVVRDVNWGTNMRQSKQHIYQSKLLGSKSKDSNEGMPWGNYIIMSLLFTFAIAGWFLDLSALALIALTTWFLMVILLTIKRMENIVPSFTNVVEIMATSMFLPFLSIYWSVQGSYKYRILHLSKNRKKYEPFFNGADGIPASA
jgi:glycosyltransferase involved in cell wall biosynthesis